MNRNFAGILSGIALIFVLVAPLPSYAASATFFGPIVPAECHCDNQAVQGGNGTVTSAPDYGCVLQVIQNLINIGISLSIIIFTIFLVLTGFAFITSAGSSQARSKAKTRFTNLFVGLLVLLSAWLIVDFVMKTLYNEEGQFGPWNAILAGQADKSDHCITAKKPTAITAGSVGTSITTAPPGTTAGGPSGNGGYTGGGLSYQPGVEKQIPYESTPLSNLLSCMATKLPAGVGQISAITEQAIANGTKTMQQCASTGCAHAAHSCHYGGTSCVGYSYAVDFGDEQNGAAIRAAAASCDPNARWNPEGDHNHISVGPESGCGCDAGMQQI